MKRSLYSLILMDDVVDEIDKLAAQMNTNRSGLVNQILADYVSLMTPEQRIDHIFQEMERLLHADSQLVPFLVPHQTTMSMKSSLQYKYRPTIKYEVQLYRAPQDGVIGRISVLFRTQSRELLEETAAFFALWKQLEELYIAPLYQEGALQYALMDGKFLRSIALRPDKDYTSEELGESISAYLRAFDGLLKRYLSGSLDCHNLEDAYLACLDRGECII